MRTRKEEEKEEEEQHLLDEPMSLPLGLASDILSRLPPKSIVRYRCVSKLWSSITTDPYFTNLFETRSLTRPSHIMFFKKSKSDDKLFVFSFPQNQNPSKEEHQPSSSSQHVEFYQLKYPKTISCFSFKESVHGLICFQTNRRPIIFNPSMKRFVSLPKPCRRWKLITVMLGYDPIEGKHKVVCMPSAKTSDSCRVLTLGSDQESWRKIETNQKHCPLDKCYCRCINGFIYYDSFVDDQYDAGGVRIMRFDVRAEKFDIIKLPSDDFWGKLIPYQGKLACVNYERDTITLWILEDAEKHVWSRHHFVTPFARSFSIVYRIESVNDAGEFICVPYTLLRSFFVLYFDPVRNSLRRVEFKGVADDEFRFRYGLGNRRLSWLHPFSNHIDTLLSL